MIQSALMSMASTRHKCLGTGGQVYRDIHVARIENTAFATQPNYIVTNLQNWAGDNYHFYSFNTDSDLQNDNSPGHTI